MSIRQYSRKHTEYLLLHVEYVESRVLAGEVLLPVAKSDDDDEASGFLVGKSAESERKIPRIANSKYDRTRRHRRMQPIISLAYTVRLQRTENKNNIQGRILLITTVRIAK